MKGASIVIKVQLIPSLDVLAGIKQYPDSSLVAESFCFNIEQFSGLFVFVVDSRKKASNVPKIIGYNVKR